MSTPYFSILIPTRNRGALLRQMLSTVIGQSFDDYEIVISDNNSTDDTRAVAEEFMKQSPRIRYVNPGRDLSMCANFDYVFEQSRGRYVTYVSDDDAVVPSALGITREIIDQLGIGILVWNTCGYYHRDVPEPAQRGRMFGRAGAGALREVPSAIPLKAYLDFRFRAVWNVVPKMLRAVVRRDLIEKCTAMTGGAFHLPPFPDHSASLQLISTNDSYCLLDLPLYVAGVSYNSNAGLSYGRKKKFDEYCSLFEGDLLDSIPYALRYVNAPYFLAGIRKFQKLYPDKFPGEVDLKVYLETELADLLAFRNTEDISAELEQLRGYMREYSGGDALFTHAYESAAGSTRKTRLKRQILHKALQHPKLLSLLTFGRRMAASLRGQKSLDLMNIPSMEAAVAIAQKAVTASLRPGVAWKAERISTLAELEALA